MFGYRSDQQWVASALWKQKSCPALSPADQGHMILALCLRSDQGSATYNRIWCHSHHQLHSSSWKIMKKKLMKTTSFCYDGQWEKDHGLGKDQERQKLSKKEGGMTWKYLKSKSSFQLKMERWNNQWPVPLPFSSNGMCLNLVFKYLKIICAMQGRPYVLVGWLSNWERYYFSH